MLLLYILATIGAFSVGALTWFIALFAYYTYHNYKTEQARKRQETQHAIGEAERIMGLLK